MPHFRRSMCALALGLALVHTDSWAQNKTALIKTGGAADDESRVIRELDRISSKENKLEQIDKIIAQDLARRNSGGSKYSTPVMKQIYRVRAAQCQPTLKRCLEIPWAAWACRNQSFGSKDLVTDLWDTVIASAGNEKNAGRLWTQIISCQKSTTLMKVVAAQSLARTAHLNKWNGLTQSALTWLKSNIAPATIGFGPAQGLTAKEGAESAAGVFVDFANELEKWEPIPLNSLLELATAQAQWLQETGSFSISSPQMTLLASQTAMTLAAGGRPLAVANLVESIMSKDGAEVIASTSALVFQYCFATWNLNKGAECSTLLGRIQSRSPDIKHEVLMAIGFLFKGDPTESINKLDALMPKIKRTNKNMIALSHLYLAIAEHARGKDDAAKANLDLYFRESPATTDAKTFFVKAFELRLPQEAASSGLFKERVDKLRTQINSKFSGKPFARTWLEFNVLLAALRSKSSIDTASAAKFLRESLEGESKQGFYQYCLDALDLKQQGKDPAPALEKAAKARGEKYPDFVEFKGLLSL